MQHRRKKAGLLQSALFSAAAIGFMSVTATGIAEAGQMIYIGTQETGYGTPTGSITQQVHGSPSGIVSWSGSYGTFTANNDNGSGDLSLSQVFTSNSINISTTTAGTLSVFLTETGLSLPVGLKSLKSSFHVQQGSLLDQSNITVDEYTYYNSDNSIFGTDTTLDHQNYSITGSSQTNNYTNSATLTGPYSVTEEFIVAATGAGRMNGTIALSVGGSPTLAPEPGTLALLGTGLLGLGLVARRRRGKA